MTRFTDFVAENMTKVNTWQGGGQSKSPSLHKHACDRHTYVEPMLLPVCTTNCTVLTSTTTRSWNSIVYPYPYFSKTEKDYVICHPPVHISTATLILDKERCYRNEQVLHSSRDCHTFRDRTVSQTARDMTKSVSVDSIHSL